MYIKKPKAILNATTYHLIVTEAPVHDEQVHYCIVTQYMCRLEDIQLYTGHKKNFIQHFN